MAKEKKTQPKAKPETNYKVISILELLKRTWLELSTFWRPLVGITAVYAVFYFIFVMGFSITSSFQLVTDETTSKMQQVGSLISSVISNVFGSAQSDATTLVQMLLFLVAALAVIWALRKLQALKAITVRDAFYQGSAQIIPVIFVTVVLLVTLLPAVLGSSVLSVALQAGSMQIGVLIIGIATGLLLFLSLFLFTMFWPAFYIASLPQTRPLQAIKSALSVTKKRRLAILRKLLFLLILILVALLAIVLPFALVLPVVVPYVFYLVLFGTFLYCQVYLYELYRSLL